MEIIIDGEASSWNYETDTSLENVIIDINEKIATEKNRIISDIKLEEFDEKLDQQTTWDKIPAGQVFKMSLQTQHVYDNLKDRFSTAIKKCSDMKKDLQHILADLNSENIENAMVNFQSSIENLLWIFKLIKTFEPSGFYSLDEVTLGDTSFNDFLADFNNTLSELLSSMENKDITLMNDFIEYELEPSLKNIIDLLFQLKESIPSSEE